LLVALSSSIKYQILVCDGIFSKDSFAFELIEEIELLFIVAGNAKL
jgi:hypothetical protein